MKKIDGLNELVLFENKLPGCVLLGPRGLAQALRGWGLHPTMDTTGVGWTPLHLHDPVQHKQVSEMMMKALLEAAAHLQAAVPVTHSFVFKGEAG